MSGTILQLNFRFGVSPPEYEGLADQLAGLFAEVKGLRWKIWLMNEGASEAGGIYCFEDRPSANAFLESPLAAQVKGHPAVSEMSAKIFEVMEGPTATTRGPVT